MAQIVAYWFLKTAVILAGCNQKVMGYIFLCTKDTLIHTKDTLIHTKDTHTEEL